MTRIRIRALIWTDWIIEHIKKHTLVQEEVEEAISKFLAHKHGYKGRYVVIGRSGRRIVSVIVKRESTGVYRVITARDADSAERRILYGKENKKNPHI